MFGVHLYEEDIYIVSLVYTKLQSMSLRGALATWQSQPLDCFAKARNDKMDIMQCKARWFK